MAIIISDSKDPCFNLALEEYLIKNNLFNEDIFLLWQSEKAFIFGRNQNPYFEINPDYFYQDIPIIRRISGGGTIYEDLNVLNFTFITKDYSNKINNYQYFLQPIISALKTFNIKAKFKPATHLFVGENKISGNAQAFINNKLMHHGTLLFNADLTTIKKALTDYKSEVSEKYIQSNKQNTINLIDLNKNLTIDILKAEIIKQVRSIMDIKTGIYKLTKDDIEKIDIIKTSKYQSWDWNFGKTKEFTKEKVMENDLLVMTINQGVITKVNLLKYQKLVGVKYLSGDYKKLING